MFYQFLFTERRFKMKVSQIYELTNTIARELLGEQTIVAEDLSNLVDIGKEFENTVGLDNYVRKLNDHIGKMVFVNRVYRGNVPSVFMDSWEFGSVIEKITPIMPTAGVDETWNLQNGQSYDNDIFYKPEITVKCFNDRVTFEIPISIVEKQVKSAFNSAAEMNSFISMIYTAIENAMTVRLNSLIMRTINNFIAETVYAEYAEVGLETKSTVKAVNLLKLFNDETGGNLTVSNALTNTDFLKYSSMKMANYIDRMRSMSKLFNIGGTEKFTPDTENHVVLLSDFKNAANFYLQSNTFNEQYTALPNAETVPFWQGSGTDYSFTDISKIIVKTSNNHTVTVTGIVGVMFDTNALGVSNVDRRVTTHYNAKGEFWNEFHKFTAGYFNDFNENFVVFFIA